MCERGLFEFRALTFGLSRNVDIEKQQENVPKVKELLNELRSGLTSLNLVSGYYQIPLRTMERSMTQQQIEQDTSDTENVCMIRNECAMKVKNEVERENKERVF